MILIAILVAAATIQECVRTYLCCPLGDCKKEYFVVRSLHCFSALNNSRKLLNTNQSPNGISCLSGIRFLTAFWTTFSHIILETNENNVTADFAWQVNET